MQKQELESNSEILKHPRIHLNESWEINHWCEVFNLRADELKEIVRQVGPEIEDVRRYLADRSLTRESNFF